MLSELYIKNFAIIDEIIIPFTNDLNLITGETGSGKSIIIEAIELLMGGRVNRSMIGKRSNVSIIEGSFFLRDNKKKENLNNMGLSMEEEDLIVLTREFSREGRSICRINGRIKTRQELATIAKMLIDIHSQDENYTLLRKENYISVIDSFSRNKTGELRNHIRDSLTRLQSLKKEFRSLDLSEAEREREMDIMEFQLDEIDQLDLEKLDENDLNNEFVKLSNVKALQENIIQALHLLRDEDYDRMDISSQLQQAEKWIDLSADLDKDLDPLIEQIKEIICLADELSYALRRYYDGLTYDDEKLYRLDEKIRILTDLKRKYGKSIGDILTYRENILQTLHKYHTIDQQLASLQKQMQEEKMVLMKNCRLLTEIRKKLGKGIEEKLLLELDQLNMKKARFEIKFSELHEPTVDGIDQIDFMIATNPGEALKSLSLVASGGEVSRVILGLKTMLADLYDMETLIFDEIDSGISGRSAQIVGEKIFKIGLGHQVIAVSHLAQIAALADNHLLIKKEQNEDNTLSHVQRLNEEERVWELARLIGGISITETTMKQASEMIEQANNWKERVRR